MSCFSDNTVSITDTNRMIAPAINDILPVFDNIKMFDSRKNNMALLNQFNEDVVRLKGVKINTKRIEQKLLYGTH